MLPKEQGEPGLRLAPALPSRPTRLFQVQHSLMGARSGTVPGVGWTPPSHRQGLRSDITGFKPLAVSEHRQGQCLRTSVVPSEEWKSEQPPPRRVAGGLAKTL